MIYLEKVTQVIDKDFFSTPTHLLTTALVVNRVTF